MTWLNKKQIDHYFGADNDVLSAQIVCWDDQNGSFYYHIDYVNENGSQSEGIDYSELIECNIL